MQLFWLHYINPGIIFALYIPEWNFIATPHFRTKTNKLWLQRTSTGSWSHSGKPLGRSKGHLQQTKSAERINLADGVISLTFTPQCVFQSWAVCTHTCIQLLCSYTHMQTIIILQAIMALSSSLIFYTLYIQSSQYSHHASNAATCITNKTYSFISETSWLSNNDLRSVGDIRFVLLKILTRKSSFRLAHLPKSYLLKTGPGLNNTDIMGSG